MRIKTTATAENRKALVKTISEFLREEQYYLGPPSFAYRVGGFTIERNGDITSETEKGCEELKDYLKEKGYLEPELNSLEISVPIEGMEGNALRNLVFMLKSKQHLMNRVVGCNNFAIGDELIAALTDALSINKEEFLFIFQANGGSESNPGINFDSEKVTFTFTISDNAEKNRAYIEVAALMVARAKEAKRVSATEQKPDNEKYYLRIWLLRLGLTGDGGKTSRKALLQGLNGHTAFRTPADEEKHKTRMLAKKNDNAQRG